MNSFNPDFAQFTRFIAFRMAGSFATPNSAHPRGRHPYPAEALTRVTMGFFEKAGRRVEQFKQEALSTAEAEANFECEACGERLHASPERCPACDADAVVPVEGDDDAEGSGTDDRR